MRSGTTMRQKIGSFGLSGPGAGSCRKAQEQPFRSRTDKLTNRKKTNNLVKC